MAIKDYFDVVKTVGRYLILIPFLPILLIIMYILSKTFEANSQIPEDLDEQVKLANDKNSKVL